MKLRMVTWVLVGLLAGVGMANAAPPHAAPPSRPHSLEQAVRQVQHQTHGHILAADTVSRGRTEVYRIKVLTPRGKVQVMQLHSTPRLPHRMDPPPESHQGGY